MLSHIVINNQQNIEFEAIVLDGHMHMPIQDVHTRSYLAALLEKNVSYETVERHIVSKNMYVVCCISTHKDHFG